MQLPFPICHFPFANQNVMIAQLNTALAQFEEQARAGTIRGPGTPAIAMYDAQGQRITAENRGGGAFGAVEMIGVGLLALSLFVGGRACRPDSTV